MRKILLTNILIIVFLGFCVLANGFEHDVSFRGITGPSSANIGEEVKIDIQISNEGDYDEEVEVLFSDGENFKESKIIDLLRSDTEEISFIWIADTGGFHILSFEALIDGEEDIGDNEVEITVYVRKDSEKIDGLCGNANNKSVRKEQELKDYGLCFEGNFNNINIDNGIDFYGIWYWVCRGINGGEDDFCRAYEREIFCGDGIVDPGESCDDGDENGDYGRCNLDCSGISSYCGDGIRQPQEQCDKGIFNTNIPCSALYGSSCSYCDNSCYLHTIKGDYCGDGDCQSNENYEICSQDCEEKKKSPDKKSSSRSSSSDDDDRIYEDFDDDKEDKKKLSKINLFGLPGITGAITNSKNLVGTNMILLSFISVFFILLVLIKIKKMRK